MLFRSALLVGAFALLAACGSGDASRETSKRDDATRSNGNDPEAQAQLQKQLAEKPWEIVSKKGETYLPNVFYAEASENEQIMPYALDGHVMIDRLVYPTIGNPNLFTKADPNDEVVVVLRIEDAAFAYLTPKLEPAEGGRSRLVVPSDSATGFSFFLIPRGARTPNTESKTAIASGGTGRPIRIVPSEIIASPEPADMPAVLKQRHTLRAVFRQDAMAAIPPGLYDLRFEVKKDNQIYQPPGGGSPVYEYQYNAVRVFDTTPDEYSILNITDTQVSVGSQYEARTRAKLDEVVQFINTSSDPNVINASFISFNGDLHNGGSPGSLRQAAVATTYADEAKTIVSTLKWLPMPIFLTTGNHDGYVATGHVPSAVVTLDWALGTSLREIIVAASPKGWPNFDVDDFDRYIKQSEAADALGGFHRDVFGGSFSRTAKVEGFAGWKEQPSADRNYILYDGFYQWQKTYGPLYYSHKFGKNLYVSLNSFELRQHRRSGWGMYTVNYGGGMSDVQLQWLDRELLRGSTDGSDIILSAHHDPRGGHRGQDHGYYFEQVDYRSMYQSSINYLAGQVWDPSVCKLPDWAIGLSSSQADSCTHDGLQEWMRPDPEFDCDWDKRKADFTCEANAPAFASGVELTRRFATSEHTRTVLLGHTHYNSLEVIQQGEELLPDSLANDGNAARRFASLEIVNPIRGFSELRTAEILAGKSRGFFAGAPTASTDYQHNALDLVPMERSFAAFVGQYAVAVSGWQRTLSNTTAPRELVVLRLVSNSDLADQTYSSGKSAFGFSTLHLSHKNDARGVEVPQINRVTFFVNAGEAKFDNLQTIDIDRMHRLEAHAPENPIEKLYEW